MRSITTNQKIFLSTSLILAFALSGAYSFYFQIQPAVDAKAYDAIAQNIVAGNGYRESLVMPLVEDNAIMRVGPGYELFLAFLYFTFGHHYAVVWVIQALLHVLTALLVFMIARDVFEKYQERETIGLISALFIGLSPDLITISGMLMTETLGIFLVALTGFVFLKLFRTEQILYRDVLIIGIVLGLAALVRTPIIFLFVPISIYFLIQKKMLHFGVFGVTVVLVFLPWIIRNYQVYHAFVPTNLAYGIDLAAGNHPGASGELEPYSHNDEMIMQYGKVDATRKLTKEALLFIVYNPVEFLRITMRRISIYFSFARPTGFWFHLSGLSKAITLVTSAVYAFILFTLGFFGIGILLKERFASSNTALRQYNNKALWLFGMLIMMPLAIVGIIVETRYRFLSYPFFAIFAGYGISQLRQKDTCWACFAAVFFLLLANTGVDIINNLDRILERIQTF